MTMHRRFDRRSALIAIISGLAAASHPTHAAPNATAILAPTGTLRLAVFAGSPASFIEDPRTGEQRGVSFALGHRLAQHLGISIEVIHCRTPAEVMDLIAAGKADLAMTNATAARARDADFSRPLLEIELGYLIGPESRIASPRDIDQPGVRIGATAGSSTLRNLPPLLRHAQVVGVSTLPESVAMLKTGALDAFATNKAVLHEMGDGMPGSKVLAGEWGAESLAMAIPKGRQSALPFLDAFLQEAVASSALARAAAAAGLRGFRVVATRSPRAAP